MLHQCLKHVANKRLGSLPNRPKLPTVGVNREGDGDLGHAARRGRDACTAWKAGAPGFSGRQAGLGSAPRAAAGGTRFPSSQHRQGKSPVRPCLGPHCPVPTAIRASRSCHANVSLRLQAIPHTAASNTPAYRCQPRITVASHAPVSSNVPSRLLSAVRARSPSNTSILTCGDAECGMRKMDLKHLDLDPRQ